MNEFPTVVLPLVTPNFSKARECVYLTISDVTSQKYAYSKHLKIVENELYQKLIFGWKGQLCQALPNVPYLRYLRCSSWIMETLL